MTEYVNAIPSLGTDFESLSSEETPTESCSSEEFTDCNDYEAVTDSFNLLSLNSSTSSFSGISTPSSSIESEGSYVFASARLVSNDRTMPIVDADHSTYDSDNVSTESEELDTGAEDVDTENELESAELTQPELVHDEDDAAGDSDEVDGLGVVYEHDRFRIKSNNRADILARTIAYRDAHCRFNSTEYHLIDFLIKNDSILNSKRSMLLLIRLAILCAQGGRRRFNDTSGQYFNRIRSTFIGIVGTSERLNVNLFCLMGAYILRSFSVSSDMMDSFWSMDGVTEIRNMYRKTRRQIGGDHIWEPNRKQGTISYVKWEILRQKSKKFKYDEDFGLLIMNMIGLDLCLD